MKMQKQAKDRKVEKAKKGKEQSEEISRTVEKSSAPASTAKETGKAPVSPGPVVPRTEGKLAGRTQPGEKSVVPVKPSEEKPVTGKETAAAKKEAEPQGIKKEYSQSRTMCKVTFRLPAAAAPAAKKVTLVGDFNGWNKETTSLKKQENGDFAATLELRAGREYRFRYLIDGRRWENDWRADKYVMSPYGGDDSVVCV
jgi:hypothetical protein